LRNICGIWLNNRYSYQHGFVLLEVLIALFILAFGLLGITEMQLMSLRRNQDALWNSLARLQVNNMLEALAVADTTNYLVEWNHANAELLPQGSGTVKKMGSDGYQVQVCWVEHFAGRKCLKGNY
jgi:prepilin-type N-terminal cleavage/methylation domain-containing protein